MHSFKSLTILAGLAVAGTLMAADAPKAVLQTVMLTQVNPQGLALWDITNKAIDANGGVDVKKITAEQWTRLQSIGKALEAGGRTLATSNGITAAPPGAKLQDETPTTGRAVDVQRYLDAKPAVFKEKAQKLQETGAKVVTAATKHDGKALSDLSSDLDEVCEACHVIFWYPDLKK